MAIKVLERYETSDGRTYIDRQVAIEHEDCLPLIVKVKKLLDDHFGERAVVTLERFASDFVETELGDRMVEVLRYNPVALPSSPVG